MGTEITEISGSFASLDCRNRGNRNSTGDRKHHRAGVRWSQVEPKPSRCRNVPCFLGRSFSLRPTYDNPSDYSRQFSIDPLGLNSSLPNPGFVERIGRSNAQSRYGAVSYIASPTEQTRRCFLAGCREAGTFVLTFCKNPGSFPSDARARSIPWVIEPENDDMEKFF